MSSEDRIVKHLEMYNYVVSNNATYWTCNFLSELDRSVASWRSTLEHHHRLYSLVNLDFDLLRQRLGKSHSRLFLFDFETIFTKTTNNGHLLDVLLRLIRTIQRERRQIISTGCISSKSKSRNNKEEDLIFDDNNVSSSSKLSIIAENHVFVLSSQTRSVISSRFKDQPGLGLVAENGCFIKYPNTSEWTELLPDTDLSWRQNVLEILEYYTERTPGSEIENKEISISWNWRQADPNFG